MRRHGAGLMAMVAVLAAAASGASVGSTATSVIRDVPVGHGVSAPGAQPDTEVEPSLAADPRRPGHAVLAFQSGRMAQGAGAAAIGVAVTWDAGAHWSTRVLPHVSTYSGGVWPRVSDPVVAFGLDDVVHVTSLALDESNDKAAVLDSVSHDGGRTWSGPFTVTADPSASDSPVPAGDDKEWVTVDTGRGDGHHPGRVYVTWGRLLSTVAAYSDDDGRTWHGPYVIVADSIVSTPVVTNTGDLLVSSYAVVGPLVTHSDDPDPTADNAAQARIQISRVAGAGRLPTGAPLAFVTTAVASFDFRRPGIIRAGGAIPMVADASRPVVHVLWEDTRDGGLGLLSATSMDGGATWAAPRRVVPASSTAERWAPTATLARDGVLRVSFRTWSRVGELIDTGYTVSRDDGKTFSPPIRVNRSVRTDHRRAAIAAATGQAFLGDYDGIAAAGGVVYVTRAEATGPSGVHQRIWVAVLGS
ncbi:MAG: hypothetical protein QOK42_1649 [Frankiaceae bacterium]|nr:hypothetical protein [Frankiaceae bacterium]